MVVITFVYICICCQTFINALPALVGIFVLKSIPFQSYLTLDVKVAASTALTAHSLVMYFHTLQSAAFQASASQSHSPTVPQTLLMASHGSLHSSLHFNKIGMRYAAWLSGFLVQTFDTIQFFYVLSPFGATSTKCPTWVHLGLSAWS